MRNDNALLLDMLNAARKAHRFTAHMNRQDFDRNELVQSAVIRELQVIGEAARLISDDTKEKHTDIPWHAIRGMRNRMIHEYFDINFDIVWDTLQQNIPSLIEQLAPLIPPEDDNGNNAD